VEGEKCEQEINCFQVHTEGGEKQRRDKKKKKENIRIVK
jgi:hypothetical protein